MLLTIDVGNTKTVVGVFDGTQLLDSWYFDTDAVTDAASATEQLELLLEQSRKAGHADPDSASISSVRAVLADAWSEATAAAFNCEPLLCTTVSARELGLYEQSFEDRHEVGPDLVADAVAARAIYGSPCVIVDFGTATTIEFLDEQGRFAGVSIAPGAESSMAALFKEAEAINVVPVEAPQHVVGTSTVESVQSGIVFGEAARADGLVQRGLQEMGLGKVPVIATGGLCELVSAHSREITAVDKMLTLRGLQMMDAARTAQREAEAAEAVAAQAEEAARVAAEKESRLRTFRSGEYHTAKVTALKGSPFNR